MKFYFVFLLWLFWVPKLSAQGPSRPARYERFSLTYVRVGMGSNMFNMAPKLTVRGTRFVHSLVQGWSVKGFEQKKPKVLRRGILRPGTIDSIWKIAAQVKGDSIYKCNTGVMSGAIIYLTLNNGKRRLHYTLHNAFDADVQRMLDLLNTYLPDEDHRLGLMEINPNLINIH